MSEKREMEEALVQEILEFLIYVENTPCDTMSTADAEPLVRRATALLPKLYAAGIKRAKSGKA